MSILPLTTMPEGELKLLELPKSWYIRFNSDEDRAREIELAHMPATFSFF